MIALPEEFDSVLGEWHLSRFKGLSEEEQKAEAAKLAPRIKVMNEEFSDLTRAMESRNIFAGGRDVLDWENFVKSQYEDDPKIVAKVMFVMLASHFQGDDLANLQIEKWVELKKDPATVFELLQLHQTDVNPIKSLLFQKWVAFVQLRYPNPKKMADQVLLSILAKHFENNDDALCSALVAGTKTGSAKIVAERLLGHQLSLWGKEKIGKSGKFL
ncbi:unnamed protein product [Peronospora farinosa]|uniref:Uncharacterized protein n=1 Tax=Peronospora farinosa TaxID=134698 RepID=A0AAV0SS38_9STRA|nr:unnamed protein product [Peronospora farinosa]